MNATTKRRGLTRGELARRLDISVSGVDDLIRGGLKPVGRRGRANLFRLRDAKARQHHYAKSATTAHGRELLGLLHAQEQAALDQLYDLEARFVEPALWKRHWNKFRSTARRHTKRWPATMAACDRLTARETLRGLLNGFIVATESIAVQAQREVLDGPPRPALVDAPKTIGEAKHRLMRARAAVVRLRGRVKREKWPTRAEVKLVTMGAITEFKFTLWRTWPGRLAQLNIGQTAREAAEDVLRDALERLDPARFLWIGR